MKKFGKHVTSFILCVIIVLNLFCTVSLASDVTTGTSNGIKYSYDSSSKVLTISPGTSSVFCEDECYVSFDKRVYKAEKAVFAQGITGIECGFDVYNDSKDNNLFSSLTEICIPASVRSMEYDWLDSLKKYTVSPDNPNYSSVDGVLFNKSKTKLLFVPMGKTGSYTVPSTTVTIDDAQGCNLSSITIPKSVQSISSGAFIDCSKLKTIRFSGSAPKMGENAFYGVSATIYYPLGDTWTSAYLKKHFSNKCSFVGSAATSSKPANTISVNNIKKSYSTKAQNFSLGVKVKDGAKVTYKSDNKNISISSKGKVTIKKKYLGRARITVTTAATKSYAKTVRTIIISVIPKKPSITSIKSSSGKITFKLSKVTCSGYEIECSTKKNFDGNSTVHIGGEGVTFLKYNKSGYTFSKFNEKKLKKGTTYYIRVRAVKGNDELDHAEATNLYSNWVVKSIKAK